MSEKYLITSALPYANGPIHFGHIAGAYLPADIYVRYLKMQKKDVLYVCGTDEHGVAVTISAKKEGITPQEQTDKYHKIIKDIFDKFNIQFDNFSRTSLEHHYKLSQEFFTSLDKNGFINTHVIDQLYCEHDNMFLADRYVEGTCPYCGSESARGDECGSCGAWIDLKDLVNPKCKLCGNTPAIKKTKHWFLNLEKMQPMVEKWIDGKKHWKENVTKFVKGLFKEGLKERCITRDMSWGVPIPLADEDAKGKVLYVWFDAPIGYISSSMEWSEKIGQPDKWKDYWFDPECKLIHFIGKDNIPFHCIVFPAMLMGQEKKYVIPENVPANEFYNLEGKQFSKSEGWYIDIDDFFTKYSADSIRYVIATNMPENKDSEFLWKDFQNRNNGELADTLGNFVNRGYQFALKYFDGKIPSYKDFSDYDKQTLETIKSTEKLVGSHIEKHEIRKALYEVMELARLGNKYIDEKAPWKSIKADVQDCANTIFVALQLTKVLSIVSFPFIPSTAEKLWYMLGFTSKLKDEHWQKSTQELLPVGQGLNKMEILFTKIEDEQINKEIEKMKNECAKVLEASKPKEYVPVKPLISYEDFSKVDFRIAKIIEAEEVPKSKKLVKLQIDLGFEKRQIVAGIKEHYSAKDLVGKTIIVVANLLPAKLMGIDSHGMLLAAHNSDGLVLMTSEKTAECGSTVS